MNLALPPIAAVAELLLGEANARLSSDNELRYGAHGSLAIDLTKDCWHDHERNVGGGVLALIERETGKDTREGQYAWLREQGLVEAAAPKSGKSRIVATYDYRDEAGSTVFQVVRFEPKTFRQRRPDGSGGWTWKVKGARPVPYMLPALLAADIAGIVFVVEGEKDCDRLAALGLTATCNAGGAGKWHDELSSFLRDRRVAIIPDNDHAGTMHAKLVQDKLLGVTDRRVVRLPDLPDKGDVSDWLHAGGTANQLLQMAEQAFAQEPVPIPAEDDDKERKPSQTDLLVKFARDRFDLLHDRNGDAYAKDRQSGEVRRLGSRQFKDRLIAGFFEQTEIAVRDQAWREALGTLQALARFSGEPQQVDIRVAGKGGGYWLDLCQPGNARAVEIDNRGWRIVDNAPVLFVRGESMQPLPDPASGKIDALWSIANIPERQRLLVLTWLIDCLRPETPFPGLELIGEQGSGKSTAAEALRRLIDPNACNLRGAPKETQDIFVAAGQAHVVAYENVSHLAGPMQDALAILSTGGGFAKRQLYTDGEEHIISVRRPWMVNGISIAVTQQDLVDRVISIECPVIAQRQSSSHQWLEFEQALPGILGALLTIAAEALAHLPKMSLPADDRPRLVEFVLLGMAIAKACGKKPEDFLEIFKDTRAETVARTLDASPVAAAVLEYVEMHPTGIDAPVKEILQRLESFKPAGAEAWPRTPKGLGDALRRAAPALRQLNVECKSAGKGSGGVVRWTIRKKVVGGKSHKSQVTNQAAGHGTSGTSDREVSLEARI